MTLEESKEVMPMMEAMITQIEEQQNIMSELLQEIQEKDEKRMCFQEQEERLQQLEKELSELLQILPDTEELLASFLIDTVTPRGMSYSKVIISIGRYRKCGEAWYFNEFEIQCFCVLTGSK